MAQKKATQQVQDEIGKVKKQNWNTTIELSKEFQDKIDAAVRKAVERAIPHADIETRLEERVEEIKAWYDRQLSRRVAKAVDESFEHAVRSEVSRILAQASSIADREGRELRVVDLDKPE